MEKIYKKKSLTKGEIVELKDVLYFSQPKSGYDNKATKDHVKAYPGLFQEFLTAHPKFVLPKNFTPEEIGAASMQPVVPVAPVVEAPKAHGKGKHE